MNRNDMIETDGRLSALEFNSKTMDAALGLLASTVASLSARVTANQAQAPKPQAATHDTGRWSGRTESGPPMAPKPQAQTVVDALAEQVETLERRLKASEFARKMDGDRARRAEDELMNIKSEAQKPTSLLFAPTKNTQG